MRFFGTMRTRGSLKTRNVGIRNNASNSIGETPTRSCSRPHSNGSINGAFQVATQIIAAMHAASDSKTKAWFSNYVKNTTWIGCKTPQVRSIVLEEAKQLQEESRGDTNSASAGSTALASSLLLDNSIYLMQQPESDVKLAGMILVSEVYPREQLHTMDTLNVIKEQILEPETHITDWSTADWLALRVLKPIVFNISQKANKKRKMKSNLNEGNSAVEDDKQEADQKEQYIERAMEILSWGHKGTTLWYRRCGVIPFLQYDSPKHLATVPRHFGRTYIDAIERCLLASPRERFTQTGCAWPLRYILLIQPHDNDNGSGDAAYAYQMILRHGSLWNTEAKRSMTEKLSSSNKQERIMKKAILALQQQK